MWDDNVDMQKIVGRVIRAERLRRGFKFTLFCYEHGIPTTTLYMLEQGSRKIRVDNLFNVINALGMSFSEFGALIDQELTKNM